MNDTIRQLVGEYQIKRAALSDLENQRAALEDQLRDVTRQISQLAGEIEGHRAALVSEAVLVVEAE
jgi:chromosome segregation ATPase